MYSLADACESTESRLKPRPLQYTQTEDQTENKSNTTPLPVALGNTLELVLLLDSIGVGRTLGGVDQLLSKALSNALDVAERGLASTDGEQRDGLVHATERRHIDGWNDVSIRYQWKYRIRSSHTLATDGTLATDTGGVLTGTAVDNGVNGNLERVLVGHDVDLN
jgi:hypothetical protein